MQIDEEKDTDNRKCMQEHSRSYETMDSLDNTAKCFGTPQGMRTLGTRGMLFKLQVEGPIRYQRVNIPNLDKLTALEWITNRGSGWPLAKQEVLLRQYSDLESFFTSQNAIKSLERRMWNNTCLVCFQTARRTNSVALPFLLVLLLLDIEELG